MEGCFHIVNGDNTTQFLSSGTEDYFLSASYFDEGVFAGSEAGLTWRGAGGDLSAYKTHQRDVLPFHGGMQFVWRNNEGASPKQPPRARPRAQTSAISYPLRAWGPTYSLRAMLSPHLPLPRHHRLQFPFADGQSCPNRWPQASRPRAPGAGLRTGPMNLTSIVYYYAWPAA